jgi:hypothetical protein
MRSFPTGLSALTVLPKTLSDSVTLKATATFGVPGPKAVRRHNLGFAAVTETGPPRLAAFGIFSAYKYDQSPETGVS